MKAQGNACSVAAKRAAVAGAHSQLVQGRGTRAPAPVMLFLARISWGAGEKEKNGRS